MGKDALGALAAIHAKLYEAKVNVYTSSGVADGLGGYGYGFVIYVRGQDYDVSSRGVRTARPLGALAHHPPPQ
jgi:hypothetical protein